jgi:hypothetical protein
MIIFGTKARQQVVGSGEFYCPKCQAQRRYELKKAKRYFTLYFVPLIPMGDLGEFVECQTCHTAFSPDVLKQPRPLRKLTLAEMLNSTKTLLDKGTPVEYIVRDLTAAGVERDVALVTIDSQIGKERKICRDCNLTYAVSVDTCAECHKTLEPYAE